MHGFLEFCLKVVLGSATAVVVVFAVLLIIQMIRGALTVRKEKKDG